MAQHPHDDKSKKPNGAQPPTPKPAIPNMSLDEPIVEEPLEVEEFFEEDVPVAAAAPAEPEFELADEDVIEVIPEEVIAEAAPASEVVEVVPEEDDVFAEEVVEATGSSAVLAAPASAVEKPHSEVVPTAAAPTSDVDLMQLFGDAPASGVKKDVPSPVEAMPVAAAPTSDVNSMDVFAETDAEEAKKEETHKGPSFAEALATASAKVEDVPPTSEVKAAESIFAEGVTQPIPAASDVKPAHFDSGMTQPMAPKSGAITSDPTVHSAPLSDFRTAEDVGEEIVESAPLSDVIAAEEVVEEAAPASEVFEAEEFVDVAPASEVKADDMHFDEEVAEAAPASEVKSEDVLFEEEVAEAGPGSEAKSAEIVEELAAEPSSATRKAEAVLDDELAVAHASEVIEEATAEEDVFDAEDADLAPSSSAVLSDVTLGEGSAVKKPASGIGRTVEFEKTVAFSSPSSAARKPEDDALFTEEDTVDPEGSSVNLGDLPSRKGSSAAGIDKVAEALESDVDLEAEAEGPQGQLAKTVPSVEFDELLDEMDDAEEAEEVDALADEDGSTEFDAEAVEEEIVSSKKGAVKGKPAVKSTGDDIDLDALFGEEEAEEAEAAEAFDAEEAEAAEAFDADEAEAAEAFDAEDAKAAEAFDADEVEAAEAFDDEDEKPAKKSKAGKKPYAKIDEDEEEEEDFSAKKGKKGKKEKPVPVAAQSSTFLRVFVGMFLATLIIAGGAGAAWWLAPDQLVELAYQHPEHKRPEPPKPHVPTNLEKAHEAMDEGKFQEAIDLLKDAAAPAEQSARGTARWFAIVKENPAPGADDPRVKEALTDLEKGKNDVLLAQARSVLTQKTLKEELTKAAAEKVELDKQLADATTEKAAAEKRIDDAKKVLIDGKYIKKDASFEAKGLQEILKGLSDDRAMLETVNEILADAKIKGTGKEGLEEVLKIKKGLEENIAAVDKVLKDAAAKDTGDKGVTEIVKARNDYLKDRDDLVKTLADAFKELVDGKIVKDGADPRKEIVAGTKLARQKAESPLAIPLAQLGSSLGTIGSGTGKVVEQSFDLAKVFSELGYFRGREKFIQTPEQKMNNYIALLQDRSRSDPKELNAIKLEAEWVLSAEAKATPESRAKALYVQGLGLRNQLRFAEAKAAFDESLKLIPKSDPVGSWNALARRSHKEITDPTEYYLPRVAQFQAEGNLKAALAEANLALKVMPTDARLFAQRGLIRYEMVRGAGTKIPDEAQKDIRADADVAGKDARFAADSAYLVGLLEEELGNWTEAEKLYRQAIKTDNSMNDEGGKYRVALARLLLRDRPEAPAVTPAPANEEKKKKDDADEEKKKKDDAGVSAPLERTIAVHPWSFLVVSAVITQAQPFDELENKETLARLNETLKLAEELIASKNEKIRGQGYLLKGSALSKLGKRSQGLQEYSKGLKLIYPGIETKDMNELIADHPAFQRPDADANPNPIMAERHFGEGTHYYWAKQYPQAEAQFAQALKYYDRDARFEYFLGLAQLHQKTKLKRDAAMFSFERGAHLEARAAANNPDAVRDINASLERIQGELRQYLNSQRYKARTGELEVK